MAAACGTVLSATLTFTGCSTLQIYLVYLSMAAGYQVLGLGCFTDDGVLWYARHGIANIETISSGCPTPYTLHSPNFVLNT